MGECLNTHCFECNIQEIECSKFGIINDLIIIENLRIFSPLSLSFSLSLSLLHTHAQIQRQHTHTQTNKHTNKKKQTNTICSCYIEDCAECMLKKCIFTRGIEYKA